MMWEMYVVIYAAGKCHATVKQRQKFICKWHKECEQMDDIPCLNVFKE